MKLYVYRPRGIRHLSEKRPYSSPDGSYEATSLCGRRMVSDEIALEMAGPTDFSRWTPGGGFLSYGYCRQCERARSKLAKGA